MGRKHRVSRPAGTAGPAAVPALPPEQVLPAEWGAGDLTVPLLATMIFLAPAVGVPHEEMLQDTLKSMLVSFVALVAAAIAFWRVRRGHAAVRWHAILWLPIALMAYALGSIAWSHHYLASVEAIRWFIFSLLAWLALNSVTRERLPLLAAGIHAGALVASLWAILQFLFALPLFPQGPNPGSTFVNRNFFAEFAVCTLPFGLLLLARARQSAAAALLAFSCGFVVAAIMMTGTRSALVALWLQLALLLPLFIWRCRGLLAWSAWPRSTVVLAAGAFAAAVGVLGSLPSNNSGILDEGRGGTGIARALNRTQAIQVNDGSLNLRLEMWKATGRMIADRPLAGVGAGAWESEVPRYSAEGTQLETDYYAHNEFLQLVAEYGIAGWLVLLLLLAWLSRLGWRTLLPGGAQDLAEVPGRAVLLGSLLVLFLVSNIGFPWRMASTAALFALCLGALAASEARTSLAPGWRAHAVRWSPLRGRIALVATAACLVLATVISQRAAEAEFSIVRATRMALTITQSGEPNHPRWAPVKEQMLQLIRRGIEINPHYRKITPMVADELARWGDWKNAAWIWESVVGSRPNVVAILGNAARAYAVTGQPAKAQAFLDRARALQPTASGVRAVEMILLSRTGRDAEALQIVRQAVKDRVADFELLNTGFLLAWRQKDYPLAFDALKLRIQLFPQSRITGYLQLGDFYAGAYGDETKAIEAYKQAILLAPPERQAAVLQDVPDVLRADVARALAAAQTSANSK